MNIDTIGQLERLVNSLRSHDERGNIEIIVNHFKQAVELRYHERRIKIEQGDEDAN